MTGRRIPLGDDTEARFRRLEKRLSVMERTQQTHGLEHEPGGEDEIDFPPTEPLPPDPPDTSPTPVVTGHIRSLIISAPRPPRAQTLEIHVATTDASPPDASTLVTEIDGDMEWVSHDSAGADLLHDTNYFVATIAKNEGGAADPSAWVGPTQLSKVNSPDIVAEAIQASHMSAESVTAEAMEAVMGLFTVINIGRIKIDGPNNQLIVTDASENLTILIDGENGNLSIHGEVTAKNIDILGTALVRDKMNFEPGSVSQLFKVTTEPANAPTTESVWESLTLGTDTDDRRGMWHDPNGHNPAGGTQPTFLVGTRLVSGQAGHGVREFRASDGAHLRDGPSNGPHAINGVVRAGDFVYELLVEGSVVVLTKRNQTDLTLDATKPSQNISSDITGPKDGAALGYDGTHLLVATLTGTTPGASERLRVRKYDPADLSLVSTVSGTSGIFIFGDQIWTGIVAEGGKWYVSRPASSQRVLRFTTSANHEAADFDPPERPWGLAHDGDVFWSLRQTGAINKHTNWTTPLSVFVAHSWHHTDGHETPLGPAKAHTHKARSRLKVSVNPLPDDANRVRVYVDEADPPNKLHATSATPLVEIDAYDSGGAAHSESAFPDAAPAEFRDAAGNVMFDADGLKAAPSPHGAEHHEGGGGDSVLLRKSSGNTSSDNDVSWDVEVWDDTDYHHPSTNPQRITIPANGRYEVVFHGRVASGTGNCTLTIRLNDNQVSRAVYVHPGGGAIAAGGPVVYVDALEAGDYLTARSTLGTLGPDEMFFTAKRLP